jgi:hypothetical protein
LERAAAIATAAVMAAVAAVVAAAAAVAPSSSGLRPFRGFIAFVSFCLLQRALKGSSEGFSQTFKLVPGAKCLLQIVEYLVMSDTLKSAPRPQRNVHLLALSGKVAGFGKGTNMTFGTSFRESDLHSPHVQCLPMLDVDLDQAELGVLTNSLLPNLHDH